MEKSRFRSGLWPSTGSGSFKPLLGFVRDGFRQLADVSHLDLRIGMSFGRERSSALNDTLRDAANTIARMPATYMTYPDGARVFPIKRFGVALRPGAVTLNAEYLCGFGELFMPLHLWRALQRNTPGSSPPW